MLGGYVSDYQKCNETLYPWYYFEGRRSLNGIRSVQQVPSDPDSGNSGDPAQLKPRRVAQRQGDWEPQ